MPPSQQQNPGKPASRAPRRRFNWVVSDYLRAFMKIWFEATARFRGERFYCRVLSGESEYNLTVNCDLTVSCSCQDYDGSGHLGDLNKSSFPEVFYGEVARRFREKLAQGELPLKTCVRCGDLARVPKSAVRTFTPPLEEASQTPRQPELCAGPEPRLPHRGMLLENTVRCNIDCIGCDRQSAARIRSTLQMDLDKLARMADLVHDLRLEQLFYLNLGEPFLSPNIGREMPILRSRNPDCRIVISTNGIVLNTDAKREAALHASLIFFSIAGVNDEMLRKYERFGSFEKAYANLKAMVAYRNARGLTAPVLEWKYLLFNWNDKPEAIRQAIDMARAAGADVISFWPTNNPFYGFSWRYRLGSLNRVGKACWKGREVDLRQTTSPAAVRECR